MTAQHLCVCENTWKYWFFLCVWIKHLPPAHERTQRHIYIYNDSSNLIFMINILSHMYTKYEDTNLSCTYLYTRTVRQNRLLKYFNSLQFDRILRKRKSCVFILEKSKSMFSNHAKMPAQKYRTKMFNLMVTQIHAARECDCNFYALHTTHTSKGWSMKKAEKKEKTTTMCSMCHDAILYRWANDVDTWQP